MKTQLIAAVVLSLALSGSAMAQMAAEKPMAAGAMSSDHMKAEKPAKTSKMKKPMAKAKTAAMAKPAGAMATDAMAKH